MDRPALTEKHARYAWLLLGLLFLVLFVHIATAFIGTVIITLFFYYATRPFYLRIKRVLRNATLSAITAIFVVSLPILLLTSYTITIAYSETVKILERYEGDAIEGIIKPYVDVEFVNTVSSLMASPSEFIFGDEMDVELLSDLVHAGVESITYAGGLAIRLMLVLVFTFYLLRDGQKLFHWARDEFDLHDTYVEEYAIAVDNDFHNVFFGNILNAVITGVIAAISYSLLDLVSPTPFLNLPYPALIGFLCGLASLIPIVGMKLVYVPVAGYLMAVVGVTNVYEYLWFPVGFIAVSAVIVDGIPDIFLRPYISGRDIHVGSLMIAYILGPIFFGWYGLFLGPMILVLLVHFLKVVLPALTSTSNRTLDEF